MTVSENPNKVWLFNLKEDPTEQHDIASRHPEKVAELRRLLNAHNAEQAESLWEAIGEMPNRPDKTAADPWVEGEEYLYWPG